MSDGADVRIVYLPSLPDGAKCGLDDFLAAGHTRDDLLALASTELRRPPARPSKPAAPKPTVPAPKTAELLAEIVEVLRRFVVFVDDAHAFVLALFVVHTWAFEAAETTPYIVVLSPEKRSGKTRLLEVLKPLCRASLHTASITEAAIYQVVAHFNAPTLLIDEVDAIFAGTTDRAEALRGIINAGNRRGVPAIRGGQDGTPLIYEAFCPKVLAGINTGRLPATIEDRAIPLPMERKLRGQAVERLKSRKLAAELEAGLHARIYAWAHAHRARLDGWEVPESITDIDDRAEEAWEPLLAIAALADPDHYERAVKAAKALAGATASGADSTAHKLLAATRAVFGKDNDRVSSADLVDRLNGDADLGYGDWNDGKGIRPADVARYLSPYRVRPATIRVGEKTAKGYHRAPLEVAWARYLPASEGDRETGIDTRSGPDRGSFAVTPVTTAAQSQKRDFEVPSQNANVTASRNAANPHSRANVTAVTAEDAENGRKRDVAAQGALFNGRPASAIDADLLPAPEYAFSNRAPDLMGALDAELGRIRKTEGGDA